jgi:hypothetical protein
VLDGITLAQLRLLVRQPGPGGEMAEMGTAQIETLDWMDENGIEPGDEF